MKIREFLTFFLIRKNSWSGRGSAVRFLFAAVDYTETNIQWEEWAVADSSDDENEKDWKLSKETYMLKWGQTNTKVCWRLDFEH